MIVSALMLAGPRSPTTSDHRPTTEKNIGNISCHLRHFRLVASAVTTGGMRSSTLFRRCLLNSSVLSTRWERVFRDRWCDGAGIDACRGWHWLATEAKRYAQSRRQRRREGRANVLTTFENLRYNSCQLAALHLQLGKCAVCDSDAGRLRR